MHCPLIIPNWPIYLTHLSFASLQFPNTWFHLHITISWFIHWYTHWAFVTNLWLFISSMPFCFINPQSLSLTSNNTRWINQTSSPFISSYNENRLVDPSFCKKYAILHAFGLHFTIQMQSIKKSHWASTSQAFCIMHWLKRHVLTSTFCCCNQIFQPYIWINIPYKHHYRHNGMD